MLDILHSSSSKHECSAMAAAVCHNNGALSCHDNVAPYHSQSLTCAATMLCVTLRGVPVTAGLPLWTLYSVLVILLQISANCP